MAITPPLSYAVLRGWEPGNPVYMAGYRIVHSKVDDEIRSERLDLGHKTLQFPRRKIVDSKAVAGDEGGYIFRDTPPKPALPNNRFSE
jgi:hypothetical protein